MQKNIYWIAFFLGFLFLSPKVEAAYLYLDPPNQNIQPGEEFDVALKINSEGEKPTTSDALIEYDSENLTLVDVIKITDTSAAFPEIIERVFGNSIYIGAYIRLGTEPKAIDAPIAILRFKGLSEAQANVTFMCTEGDTRDSNISLKKNRTVTDVIDCSKVVNGTYIISRDGSVPPTPTLVPGEPTPTGGTGGTEITPTAVPSQPTATPTPLPTATPTLTPIPSILPETGVFDTTGNVILLGVGLTIVSLFVKFYIL